MDSIFEMEDYPKVLNRLQNQCAKREYCSSDIYKKAYSAFDGDRELALKLVESLVADKFVDDLRFASAFAREKSRLSGWGKVKISYMLAGKGIPKDVVDKALEEIDEDEAHRRMVSVLEATAGEVQVAEVRLDTGIRLRRDRSGGGRDCQTLQDLVTLHFSLTSQI